MVMATLLFYCLKDINFVKTDNFVKSVDLKGFVPYFIGVISTVGIHILKRNSLLSIFGGTIIYMILIRIL